MILKGVIARRLNDDSRESFGQEEYDKTKDRIENHYLFTIRHLTRRTREKPMGEDVKVLREIGAYGLDRLID